MKSTLMRSSILNFYKNLYLPIIFSGIAIIVVFLTIAAGCRSQVEREWVQEDGYRWAELYPSGEGAGFETLNSSDTGISFENILREENIVENQNLLNGSGVTAGDVDGDGWTDLYFTALDGSNKLYRNLGGMEFEDITVEAGVTHEGVNSTGSVFADVDGDHDLDLLISSMSSPNALYLNDGKGSFTLKEDSGLLRGKGSMTMALADIEGDGDLDLYITNYKERQAKDIFDLRELSLENITRRAGDGFEIRPPYDEHFALLQDEDGYNQRELGEKDELYLNNGDGTFEVVQTPENVFLDSEGNPQGLDLDWGLAARFADMNGDGLPELIASGSSYTAASKRAGETPSYVSIAWWVGGVDGDPEDMTNYEVEDLDFFAAFDTLSAQFDFVVRDSAGTTVDSLLVETSGRPEVGQPFQGPVFVSKLAYLGDVDGDGNQETALAFQGVDDSTYVYREEWDAENETYVVAEILERRAVENRAFLRVISGEGLRVSIADERVAVTGSAGAPGAILTNPTE